MTGRVNLYMQNLEPADALTPYLSQFCSISSNWICETVKSHLPFMYAVSFKNCLCAKRNMYFSFLLYRAWKIHLLESEAVVLRAASFNASPEPECGPCFYDIVNEQWCCETCVCVHLCVCVCVCALVSVCTFVCVVCLIGIYLFFPLSPTSFCLDAGSLPREWYWAALQ